MATVHPTQLDQQTEVWLRGLLTIAWADGQLDVQEQSLISTLTQCELSVGDPATPFEPVSPAELASVLERHPDLAENFLRMAVMVALADGVYSSSEDKCLAEYCQALGLTLDVLTVLRMSLSESDAAAIVPETPPLPTLVSHAFPNSPAVLQPLQAWLDQMEIHDPKVAHLLCKLIPAQCPFERDVNFFGRKVVHIPALCKLNPVYEQLVGLRFRALTYLADTCGEDVSSYC